MFHNTFYIYRDRPFPLNQPDFGPKHPLQQR